MRHIRTATEADATLLAQLGATTFLESHGHSAPTADIEAYRVAKFTDQALAEELREPAHHYHILFDGTEAVGYSKTVLNVACPGIDLAPTAKLDRLYVLRSHLAKGLGAYLFHYVVDFAKAARQQGLWLYVWIENERALRFYRRQGFEVVGHFDFVVSPTHSNPNYRMLLRF